MEPVRRINITFETPDLITLDEVFNLTILLAKRKTFEEMEKFLDKVPGVRVEYINPPEPGAELVLTAHPVQLSLFAEETNPSKGSIEQLRLPKATPLPVPR